MARPKSHFPCVTTAGGLLPQDFLVQLKSDTERQSTSKIPGLQPQDYHLSGETFGEATNRAWNALQGRWEHFKAYLEEKDENDTTHGETWNRFLRPLFRELAYGQLERDLSVEIDSDTYKISHHWREVAIHLIGANVSIDKRTPGVEGAAKKSPHAMMQEFLNRSDDHLWAFVSNGLHLRILRDNVSLTRQAYVEFDLYAMFEGGEYADFQLLWLLCHQSRVEGTPPETCWLEKWATEAKQRGVRMLDSLRNGVETSINALGEGFLHHPDNLALRERLASGDLSTQDYYRQVLRIVYRLIFLFVAEDRNLLLVPDATDEAKQRYRTHYATDRLRELAQKRRGTVHPDLWEQMKLVMRALGSPTGEPALALPALGSFLWDAPRSTPDLADATLSNSNLLSALRALATIRTEKENVLRVVDYRNLGAEELGSVYESLLELHPQINLDARTFVLDSSAGNDRKTSGSYYTPDSLVQCLLDTALEPVVADRLAKARRANHSKPAEDKAAAQQQALLDLKVCDPAVGSGHFLIAAGHRIARHLARIRSGEEEPSPADYQDALRDVVGRCLYGVDINPMSVELCKVSLWIEAMEPGKPLSFLDHHIRCGNSLLGTTPTLIEKGVPDDAYKALTGDDKAACSFLKKRNKGERDGFGGLFVAEDKANLESLRSTAESIESIADDSIPALQLKELEFSKAETSSERLKQKQIADLWCAAFVCEKKVIEENADEKCTKATGFTTDHLQNLAKDGGMSGDQLEQLQKLAHDYQFFHWHVEFPGVFRISDKCEVSPNEHSRLFGGFDCILGNPPWERIQPEAVKFFAAHHPEILKIKRSDRNQQIESFAISEPPLYESWIARRRKDLATTHLLKDSGRYPLSTTKNVNSYAVFTELGLNLIATSGIFGNVLQSGIATDDINKFLFKFLIENERLVSLLDFENREQLFPAVDSRMSFSLLTCTGEATPNTPQLAFGCTNTSDLTISGTIFELSKDDFALVAPNTGLCPVFGDRTDADLVLAIYRRSGCFINESDTPSNHWGAKIKRVFSMAYDSHEFIRYDSDYSINDELTRVLEAKLFHQYNHRFANYVEQGNQFRVTSNLTLDLSGPHATASRFLATVPEVRRRHTAADWSNPYLVGYRDIARSSDERTCIACVLPADATDDTIRIIFTEKNKPQEISSLVGNLNSFLLDFVVRNTVASTHLSEYLAKQFPVLPPARYMHSTGQHHLDGTLQDWVHSRVFELTYTAWDLEPFAQDCGYDGPPFRWDEERRFQLRCELDALFFHLYLPCDDAGDWKSARIAEGAVRDESEEELTTLKSHFPTPRDAVAYIMETFPIVKRKDIKRTAQLDEDGEPIEDTGTFITKDRILEIYNQMLQARRNDIEWKSTLTPSPGSFRVAHFPKLPEASVRTSYAADEDLWMHFVRQFLLQARHEATLDLLLETWQLFARPDTLISEQEKECSIEDLAAWKKRQLANVPKEGFVEFVAGLHRQDFIKVDSDTHHIELPEDSKLRKLDRDEWLNYEVSHALTILARRPDIEELISGKSEQVEASNILNFIAA